jgi:cytochrome c5
MKRLELVMLGCLVIATSVAVSRASGTSQPNNQKATQGPQDDLSKRGQQVFNQNCYRCHQVPEGFSPSISGTVAKHMRVRANLSEEDYKALMKFLNP